MAGLATRVGRLSDAVGPPLRSWRGSWALYFEKHHGIHVAAFHRRFFLVDGREVEVDLYGEGTRDGERVAVVGEVRSRIYGRDVEALLRKVQALSGVLGVTPVPVLFGFVIHPSAAEEASKRGVVVFTPVGPTACEARTVSDPWCQTPVSGPGWGAGRAAGTAPRSGPRPPHRGTAAGR